VSSGTAEALATGSADCMRCEQTWGSGERASESMVYRNRGLMFGGIKKEESGLARESYRWRACDTVDSGMGAGTSLPMRWPTGRGYFVL